MPKEEEIPTMRTRASLPQRNESILKLKKVAREIERSCTKDTRRAHVSLRNAAWPRGDSNYHTVW